MNVSYPGEGKDRDVFWVFVNTEKKEGDSFRN